MTVTPHGMHLVGGNWVEGSSRFRSNPVHGPSREFSIGTPEHVNVAVTAAENSFGEYALTDRHKRADFLDKIADEIDLRGTSITKIGTQETGLPEGRLEGERGRTTGQLRLFADHIRKGDYLDRRFDASLPDRQPIARPELQLVQRPIGPVAVFGASNFPLAFSTAGGDTAAALAAGCPVIVKGHSAHPGTAEIVAEAVLAAVVACNMPRGIFSLVQGGKRDVGAALVQHPYVSAVGFTGSLVGGRALFDLCAARDIPIPFFGELGSINPMFILPAASSKRAREIGAGWAGSLTMGAGQFCTKPGIAFVLEQDADELVDGTIESLANVDVQPMLTQGIAQAYRQGSKVVSSIADIQMCGTNTDRAAMPLLARVDSKTFADHSELAEEVFGPLGLVVTFQHPSDMSKIARSLKGQLTCTLHMDAEDDGLARSLIPILERKAGRLLANGYPTGVEVSDTMVHGGPYPASTNFGATSVGTMSIRRFLRPVCYQNIPSNLIPS